MVALGINNFFTDYTKISVWRAEIIYGTFSTLAFSVNGYMSLRYLTNKNNVNDVKKLKLAATISLIIYLICFISNWIYHYVLLISLERNYQLFIYFTIAHLVMYDDIKLIKHLYKESYLKNSFYLLNVGNALNSLASTKLSTE